MANLTAFLPFNYETFDLYKGFETATFRPDTVNPGSLFYVDVDDNLTLAAAGTGFTYSGAKNTPASGTINAFQLNLTDVEGQFIAPVVSASGLNITYQTGLTYLFKTPLQVAEDVFKGDDRITGSGGSDDINGFNGVDTLRGNGGNDTFHFTSKLTLDKNDRLGRDDVSENHDIIRDFRADKISLETSIFKDLSESNLKFTFKNIAGLDTSSGTNDLDTNDRLLYNKNTGELFYDADGDGDNGADPIMFAVLSAVNGARPTLGAANFDFE